MVTIINRVVTIINRVVTIINRVVTIINRVVTIINRVVTIINRVVTIIFLYSAWFDTSSANNFCWTWVFPKAFFLLLFISLYDFSIVHICIICRTSSHSSSIEAPFICYTSELYITREKGVVWMFFRLTNVHIWTKMRKIFLHKMYFSL